MSIKVLAVDDSRTMRSILQATLNGAGFDVQLAEDGVHGLEVLTDWAPDVIVTDINMPRLDGFGFIEKVRVQDSLKTVPILTLTTESAPELKQRARNAGATGWITKPVNPDRLVSVIKRVAH